MSKKIDLQSCKVDDLLSNVDYSFQDYIPSKEALKFSSFIKEVSEEENETPIMHLYMMDQIFNKYNRNAILVFRGAAKSTLFSETLTLYKGAFNEIPGFGKTNLSIFVADSIENGVKNLRRNVEFRYANSDYLQWLIPKRKIIGITADEKKVESEFMEEAQQGGYRFTDVRIEFQNRNGGIHITKCYGVGTGIRGVRELNKRPVDAVFDDIIKGDDEARSPTILQSIKNTIYKDVAYALHPKNYKMIYLGTPYNQNDPLYKAIESGSWTRAVFPVCEKFPCRREDFNGAWEDRFDYDYVNDMYKTAISNKEPQSFFQELMLRVTSEEDRLIKDDDIVWYDNRNRLFENQDRYNCYITTDLATSSKQGSDYTVISVWFYSNDKKWYWVDGTVEQQTVDKTFDDIFRFVEMYDPHFVSLERQGSQKGFISLIKREMNNRNIYFAIASDKRSGEEGFSANRDKIQRFQLVVPYFKRKQILFPKELENDLRIIEAINELKNITSNGISSIHDDFIDTISHIPLLTVFEPQVEENKKRREKKEENKNSEEYNPFKDNEEKIIEKESAIKSYII